VSDKVLDLDLLRTLLCAVRTGSFKEAAAIVGRTQSAISLQMSRLESIVGVPIFERDGRGVTLTPPGRVLVDYARQMLDLSQEAIQAASGMGVHGKVSLGLMQDFAETVLPSVLATFSRAHPSIEINVQVERSSELVKGLRNKSLDLALIFSQDDLALEDDCSRTVIGKRALKWITARDFQMEEPIRLVLFAPPCLFRQVATQTLEHKMWKQTFSSTSLAGTWAAVEAGLGISIRTDLGIPRTLETRALLPGTKRLPSVNLLLLESEAASTPVTNRLKEVLIQHLREQQ
jgi:DNA-binding transcriptional LysR family regulator